MVCGRDFNTFFSAITCIDTNRLAITYQANELKFVYYLFIICSAASGKIVLCVIFITIIFLHIHMITFKHNNKL